MGYDRRAVTVGADTSNVNGRPVDAAWLVAHGLGFHAFKVSQGVWFRDRLAAGNHAQCSAHGVTEVRYHFLESDIAGAHPASGAAQCDPFLAACAAVGGDCRTHGHGIDVETQSGRIGPRYRTVTDFVARWRQRMPGHPLGVYSGSWYWVGYLGNPAFVGDWLWTSDYIVGSGDPFALLAKVTPGYWHPWGHRGAFDLRQFSSSATVDGISPCDVSVAPRRLAQLRALVLGAAAGPVHPPAPHPTPVPAPPPGWRPPPEVVALQRGWHVATADGRWGNATDALAQAVRRNHHDRVEQQACGTAADGRWGQASQAAYVQTVAHTQAALNMGRSKPRHIRVDGWWGEATDGAWLEARRRFYLHWVSG